MKVDTAASATGSVEKTHRCIYIFNLNPQSVLNQQQCRSATVVKSNHARFLLHSISFGQKIQVKV